jgi:hypothetical protein
MRDSAASDAGKHERIPMSEATTDATIKELTAIMHADPAHKQKMIDWAKEHGYVAPPEPTPYEFVPPNLRAASAENDARIASYQVPRRNPDTKTSTGALPESIATLGRELQEQIDSGQYLRPDAIKR